MKARDLKIHIEREIFMKELVKKQEEFLEDVLRNRAVPPIKGEITKGKIRWRGLSIYQIKPNLSGVQKIWVEQRGVKISEDFSYGVEIDFNLDNK